MLRPRSADGGNTNRDDWFLALDTSSQLVLLDLNNQVLSLVVAWDLEGDIDILDGLCPLVWESILLCLLLCGSCGLSGFIWDLFCV